MLKGAKGIRRPSYIFISLKRFFFYSNEISFRTNGMFMDFRETAIFSKKKYKFLADFYRLISPNITPMLHIYFYIQI